MTKTLQEKIDEVAYKHHHGYRIMGSEAYEDVNKAIQELREEILDKMDYDLATQGLSNAMPPYYSGHYKALKSVLALIGEKK